ncbi:MAG TPA: hypothetical protein VNN25_09720 [Thermoanaerobaculia bacterium]|nr:hypothetical protein [Thermoanaerobaculia bacterium]
MRRGAVTFVIFFSITFIGTTASAQIVATRIAAAQFVIPAAGALDGGNGTFFRSDITMVNYRSTVQNVRLQWLPQTVTGVGVPPTDITINASSGIASEDFVTNILHRSGLGAILVSGITPAGDFDPTAQLAATSRIWTFQPGSSGTTSQSLPVVSTADISSTVQVVLGARRDSRFRMNVGIVNLSSSQQRFQVVSAGSNGTDVQVVDVEAMSMVLFRVSGADSAIPLQIQVFNTSTTARSNSWIAYASSVDNITGDAWTTLGSNAPQ